MAYSLTFLESVYPAFSPVKAALSCGPLDPSSVQLIIAEEDGTVINTLTLEAYNLATSFDAAVIMQRLFKDELLEIAQVPAATFAKAYLDYRLHYTFKLRLPNFSAGYYLKYTAANAVLPAGVNPASFGPAKVGKFLTGFSKFYWWPGYSENTYLSMLVPKATTNLDIIMSGANIKRVVSAADTTYHRITTVSLDVPGVPIYFEMYGGPYIVTLPVEERCVPENPRLLRWINEQGGWDSWLFSGRMDHTLEVADREVFRQQVESNLDTATNYRVQHGTRTEIMKFGVQGVPNADAAVISKLVVSPRVQYLDKDQGRWVTLLNTGSKPTWRSNEPMQTLEFEFSIPSVMLQTL